MVKGKKRSRKRKRGGKAAPEQPGSNWEKLKKMLGRGKKGAYDFVHCMNTRTKTTPLLYTVFQTAMHLPTTKSRN